MPYWVGKPKGKSKLSQEESNSRNRPVTNEEIEIIVIINSLSAMKCQGHMNS